MEILEYLKKKKELQEEILKYLDEENNDEIYYQNLERLFKDQKINENQSDLTELLHMMLEISNEHHRSFNFFEKIEKIFSFFYNDIKKFYSNSQIIKIIQSNKRIICFLLQEGIISIDSIKENNKIKDEIIPLIQYDENKKIQMNDKIKVGENESFICQIIRKDLIDEFITYINQNNISFSLQIESSKYETNSFLLNKNTSLIEYSAFFGSIRIFKYLILNGTKLTSKLLIFAIHGRNPEIIHILEDNNIQITGSFFIDCLNESIKCHHNEITEYILNQNDNDNNQNVFLQSLKSFNYYYFPSEFNNISIFYDLCGFDYCSLVKILLETQKLNVNEIVISIKSFFHKIINAVIFIEFYIDFFDSI